MNEWKPDHEFLDFLAGYTSGDDFSTAMIEEMRTGKDILIQNIYRITYDTYQGKFEAYKATKQQTWSLN